MQNNIIYSKLVYRDQNLLMKYYFVKKNTESSNLVLCRCQSWAHVKNINLVDFFNLKEILNENEISNEI